MSNGYLRTAKNGTLLDHRVAPGAKRTFLEGPYGEHALTISVTRGAASRDKTVLLRDTDPHRVQKTLSTHLA